MIKPLFTDSIFDGSAGREKKEGGVLEMKEKRDKNEGWVEVSQHGEYSPWVDWDSTQEVVGVIIKRRFSESLNKNVIEVETKDGTYSVGETSLVKFDKLKEGMEIRIVNEGWMKLKNGRRARNLKIYVKEPF